MNEQQQNLVTYDEFSLLDLVLVLAKRWRLICAITLLALLLSVVFVVNQPNRYQATAKVVTLQRQLIQPINASFVGSTAVVGVQKLPLVQTNLPILQELLYSPPVLNSLAKQFNVSSADQMMKKYTVKLSKNGVIEITSEDEDPKRAAAIANAAVAAIGRIAYSLNLVANPLVTSDYSSEKDDNDASTYIKLLQPAIASEIESKPNRGLIVALGTVSSIFAAIMLAFLLEGLKSLKAKEPVRWEAIKTALKGR